MPTVTVSAPARLHVGFTNLSLARNRIYGGVGMAIDEPRTVLTVEPADAVAVRGDVADGRGRRDRVERVVGRAVETLGVAGAAVEVGSLVPPHVGLGSGTQLALAALAGVAGAHGDDVDVRDRAPAMGRGGRSGVGVATFESGGFVVDGGHPTRRFTTDPPEDGAWEVPPVVARHSLPERWRAVVAVPTSTDPVHGDDEDRRIREAVLRADPGTAEAVDRALVDHVLPGAASSDLASFGEGVSRIDRANGAWYADVQGGRYRDAARPLVGALRGHSAVHGVGQSSWGPAVFGLVRADRADAVRRRVAEGDATVRVARFDDRGAVVD